MYKPCLQCANPEPQCTNHTSFGPASPPVCPWCAVDAQEEASGEPEEVQRARQCLRDCYTILEAGLLILGAVGTPGTPAAHSGGVGAQRPLSRGPSGAGSGGVPFGVPLASQGGSLRLAGSGSPSGSGVLGGSPGARLASQGSSGVQGSLGRGGAGGGGVPGAGAGSGAEGQGQKEAPKKEAPPPEVPSGLDEGV